MSLLILAGLGGSNSWVGVDFVFVFVFICYYFYFSFPAFLEKVVLSRLVFFSFLWKHNEWESG